MKEDAKRHGIRVLNPDINKSRSVCIIEDNAVRLGFLNVLGLGGSSAGAIIAGKAKQDDFKSIGDFLERTGVLEEVALNLAGGQSFR